MGYRIEYMLLLFFRRVLLFLPEKARFAFGDFLGKVGFHCIKSRRQTALWNLQLAFPEKSEEERKQIAIKSCQIMAKYFLSTLWYETYLEEHVKIVEKEKIHKLYSPDTGLMAAVIHMGNMESAVKAAKGLPAVTVAKDQRNPFIDHFIVENRKKNLGFDLLLKSRQTVRDLHEYIKKDPKYVIALFSDHRDKGARVSFFGLETNAPTGAVSFAYKYNMPLVIAYSCMEEDNSSTIYVTEPIALTRTENGKQDVLDNTQALISRIEEIIRKHPEQWMWFHDRWNLYRNFKKEGKLPPFLAK